MNEEQNINQLPKDWKWVKLGEVCEKVETVKRKEKKPEEELLYLDIGGIDNSTNKILSHKNYKWKDAPSRAQQIVFKDDILFSTVRTYMKNIAVVENKIYDGQIASSGFCVIRSDQKVTNPKFVFYYSVSQNFLRPLNELQTGSSYPAVRDKDVFIQPFPLPSKATQQAIVSKIEELLSELDKGIENMRTAQQQLKTYRQSVLKWAFEGRLTNENVKEGELPKGWNTELLKDVCKIVGGVTKGRDFKGKATIHLPYLRVANVQDGYLDLDEIKTIEVLPTDKEKYKLLFGDILYTEGGDKDKLGRGTIWKNEIEDCIHQNHIFRARPLSREINSKYIACFSQTRSAKNYFFKHGKQTTNLASINLTILSNLQLPICSIEEQNNIVQEIEIRLSVADKMEETITQSLQQAEALRQSILKKAFEGNLI